MLSRDTKEGKIMNGLILHSDLNCFYASVEMNECPQLRGKKIAVCGSTENRHGIVLTASYPAKRSGVKTGMANWEARQNCPDLICVEPHYDLYMKYSGLVREIYHRYAEDVEPFGMDECWLSMPYTDDAEDEGKKIADEIRETVTRETGLTVSIGVSFTKVFAKLGSDMKKPDAVTVISRENYQRRVWPLPVSELLYVGRSTTRQLMLMNISTIGELAGTDPELLRRKLGKNGIMLWRSAAGEDHAPVMPKGYEIPIKSVGHGSTCVRDLYTEEEVWKVLYELAQDVARRMKIYGLRARGVCLWVRDRDLGGRQYQTRLSMPTRSSLAIAQLAFDLFRTRYLWEKPVRALTVSAINVENAELPEQTDMFGNWLYREKREKVEMAVDDVRNRFGYGSIRAASLQGNLHMASDRCETVEMPSMMYR